MAKLFVIIYNETTLPKAKLVTLFDKMPGVLTWFSQIPGSFFIKTEDSFSSRQISQLIAQDAGNITHVVIKINKQVIEDYYGRLSKELWDHFY